MPLLAVDRFLIPNLRTYTAVSVVVLCISFYYAAQAANNPTIDIDVNAELSVDEKTDSKFSDLSTSSKSTRNDTFARQVKQAAKILVQDSFSVWSMINMAYCCILLFGAFIQKVVFGELRPSEQQHIKDKFWTFIFYKFILVFGIMNVQYVHEVIFWCAWFSILGFLNLLTQLGKDRFEYLSFATPSSNWSQIRLVGLLVGVFCLTGFMLLISAVVGVFAGFNTFAFMAAECIQLNLLTIQVILKYITYMYDIRGGSQNIVLNWEKRGPVAYYTELCFELCVLFLDFLHHIHMLLWSNMFLSIASLVVCMQLRHLFYEIRKRIKRHQHYLWVARHMEENYPLATVEELSTHGDHCAICWDEMAHARKLPCSHMFHNSCLQSWLEQDTSCPTCRTSLGGHRRNFGDSVSRLDHSLDPNIENLSLNGRLPHHFFHFDGSRYVPWLPSFSVEFTHFQLDSQPPIQTYEIDAMARQIQQLFPSVPVGLIAEDLRISRSIELTIENILEGRVVVPRDENEGGNDEGRRPHEELPNRVELEVPQASQETTSEEGESSRGEIAGCQRPVLFSAETDSEGSECDFQNENSSGSSENKAFADDEPHSLKVIGGFSDSSAERERTFRLRKEQMLASARRKYLRRTQMRRNSILGQSTEG